MSDRDSLWNRIKRATLCRWLGHRYGPAVQEGDSGLRSLIYTSTCERCRWWKTEPSAIAGIDRTSYAWWRK